LCVSDAGVAILSPVPVLVTELFCLMSSEKIKPSVYLFNFNVTIGYLGICIVLSKVSKCSIDEGKHCYYRSANAMFGKIVRLATTSSVERQTSSTLWLDFVLNRFLMKQFLTNNIVTDNFCRHMFGNDLPKVALSHSIEKSSYIDLITVTIL